MFKKFLILCTVVFLVVFFTLPAIAFADTGDEYTFSGVEEQVGSSGQYTLDNGEGEGIPDPTIIPDTDVYCIDDSTYLNNGNLEYTETDEYAIDVLQEDEQGGNFGAGIDPEDAAAAEILAVTATGATSVENQNAMWDIIEGDTPLSGSIEEDIVDEVSELAGDFVETGAMDDDNPDDHGQLIEYLDEQNVNEVEVTLDPDPLVDENGDYNEFEATAIMENPLVPEVTDEDKTIYWYILASSYNVSFSETDLITETTSTMSDEVDTEEGAGEEIIDEDGDGNKEDDHYGKATVPYFFFWWGEGYPEFEEMNVNIGACVDIDSDEMIDKSEADVSSFNENMQVVQTVVNPEYDESEADSAYNSEHIVEKDIEGEVVTDVPENLDVCEQEGGKVVVSEADPVYETGSDVTYNVEVWEDEGFTGYWYNLVRHGFLDYRWEVVDQNYFERWESHTESRTSYIPYGIVPLQVDCSYWYWSGCPLDGNWYAGIYPFGIWADDDHDGNNSWYAAILDRNYTYYQNSCYINPEYSEPQIVGWTNYQRFVIENYSEPCDTETALYSAWGSFDLLKTSSVTGLAIPGAVFTLSYVSGQTYTPEVTEYILTTDADGKASVDNLPWATYELKETAAAPGYLIDLTPYSYNIGGTALFKEGVLNATDSITNTPITTTVTTTAGIVTVAALTEEVAGADEGGTIEVLGIKELPFTGSNSVFMLIGILMAVAGIAALFAVRKQSAK